MPRVIAGAGQGGGPTLAPGRYRTARQAVTSPVTASNDKRRGQGFQSRACSKMLHPLQMRSLEAVKARIGVVLLDVGGGEPGRRETNWP
jgi:hypothetical protein